MRQEPNSKNRRLIVILLILTFLIVSLTIVIIILNINHNNTQNSNDISEDTSIESSENQLISSETSEESLAIDKHLTEIYHAVSEQAQSIINTEPVNVTAINKLYDDAIAECFANNESNYAASFMRARTELLLGKNLKRDALDTLINMNWDLVSKRLGGPELYRQYTQIIELAEELGDTTTANKFKELRTTVEDAYWSDYNSTKNALEASSEQTEEE